MEKKQIETLEDLTKEERKELRDRSFERFEMLYDKIKGNLQPEKDPFETMILSVTSKGDAFAIHSFLDRNAKGTLQWWEMFYLVFREMCERTTGYSIEQVLDFNIDEEEKGEKAMHLMGNANKCMN